VTCTLPNLIKLKYDPLESFLVVYTLLIHYLIQLKKYHKYPRGPPQTPQRYTPHSPLITFLTLYCFITFHYIHHTNHTLHNPTKYFYKLHSLHIISLNTLPCILTQSTLVLPYSFHHNNHTVTTVPPLCLVVIHLILLT
jgi:hypothetical protein